MFYSLACVGAVSLSTVSHATRERMSEWWSPLAINVSTISDAHHGNAYFDSADEATKFFYSSLMFIFYPSMAFGALIGGLISGIYFFLLITYLQTCDFVQMFLQRGKLFLLR